jgi:SAM-dependent methyltransferase
VLFPVVPGYATRCDGSVQARSRCQSSAVDGVRRSRGAYSRSADRYLNFVGSTLSEQIETAADLALLARFAQTAEAAGGRVLDAGCGTGRAARLLADHGLETVGIDVADGMVDIARRKHPDVRLAIGELAHLPFASSRFVATVYWYSIITTPPTALGMVFAELARVLADSGFALIAFQSGEGAATERPNAYGTGVDLTLYRHDVEFVANNLERSGLDVTEVIEREPVHSHEDTTQAFIVVRRLTPQAAASRSVPIRTRSTRPPTDVGPGAASVSARRWPLRRLCRGGARRTLW